MWAKAIELVIEIVGTYSRQCTSMRRKNHQKLVTHASDRIATPPTR